MLSRLPARKVLAAAEACLAYIKAERERKTEGILRDAMRRKWWRFTKVHTGSFDGFEMWEWKLRWRVRTREEAIAAESYPGSELKLVKAWAFCWEDRLKEIAALAAATVKEHGADATVDLNQANFEDIESEWWKLDEQTAAKE